MKLGRGKLRSCVLRTLALATLSLVLLAVVEGLASLTITAYEMARFAARPRHTQYDAELGWVNSPSCFVPDMYGPGAYVRTDSLGFRSDHEVKERVAPGKLRVVCSGDSFAFGEGVANDRTWCHLLSREEPRLETANLGQPGYGVDQSFLLYLRLGARVEHSVHLFTFIAGDIDRMSRRVQSGYGKPVLRLEGDRLVTDNVPVPRLGPRLGRYGRRAAKNLRSVDLARRLRSRWRPGTPPADAATRLGETAAAAVRLFEELDRVSRERDVSLVLVYLPGQDECDRPSWLYPWIRRVLDRHDFDFIDLREDFCREPPDLRLAYSIPPGSDGAGHYSELGNAWVASALWERLREMTEIRDRLENVKTGRRARGVPLGPTGTAGSEPGAKRP